MALDYNPTTLGNIANETQFLNELNLNFSELATLLEDTLSRSGSAPNTWEADQDANSYDLNNLSVLTSARINTGSLFVDGAEIPSLDDIRDLYQLIKDELVVGILAVPDIATLRALTGVQDGQRVSVTSYYSGWAATSHGPAGGGEFVADTSDNTTPDDGGMVVVSGEGVRFKRPESEVVNLRFYGARGNGVDPDTAATKAAIIYCVSHQKALFCPAGTYIIRPITDSGPVYLNKGINADGMGLTMYGEGRGKTIFKEGDGETEAGGRFTTMFYCWLNDPDTRAYRYGSFSFSDITFDKNGRSNANPPTPYEWEGAHVIKFQGNSGTSGVDAVSFERVEIIDKIGAGIVLGPSNVPCRSLTIRDFQSRVHPKLDGGGVGQKGCIEVAIDSGLTVIDSVTCRYSQIEPTFGYDASRRSNFKIIDSNIDVVEYTYTGSGVSDGNSNIYIDVVNLTAETKFLLRGVRAHIANSTVKPTSEFYNPNMTMNNCTILLDYDDVSEVVSPMYLSRPAGWSVQSFASLTACDFIIDSDSVSATAGGYAVRGNNTTSLPPVAVFDNCTFDRRLYGVHDAYSTGGDFTFRGCRVAGQAGGRAFTAGAFSTFQNKLTLENNDFSQVAGPWVAILPAATGYDLRFSGDYLASEVFFSTNNAAGVSPSELGVKPTLFGDAAPTSGTWFKGQKVFNNDPAAGGVEGWVCTAAGAPGTWKSFGSIEA